MMRRSPATAEERARLLACALLHRGKWVTAALRPWTGDVAAARFEELRSAVEERADRAIDDAALAGYEAALRLLPHVECSTVDLSKAVAWAVWAAPGEQSLTDGDGAVDCLVFWDEEAARAAADEYEPEDEDSTTDRRIVTACVPVWPSAAVERPEVGLLADAQVEATRAAMNFGPHPSAEFTACRIAEEAGELVAAATSTSKGRDQNRAARMREEGVQLLAMVLRLFREWPEGRLR